MNVARLLVTVALLAYPADFRRDYGDQIAADLAEDRMTFRTLVDIVGSGICMRIDILFRDFVFAVRRLRKSPLFVAIVVLTFALGIGANIAVFSVLDAVMLKPLPFPNVDRLVTFTVLQGGAAAPTTLSLPDVRDLRAQSTTLTGIGAETPDQATITTGGPPKAYVGMAAQPEYLDAFGIRPQLGRSFTQADVRDGATSVLISDRLWRTRFNADPAIVGKPLTIDQQPYVVVGVLAHGAQIPDLQSASLRSPDFIKPLRETTDLPKQRSSRYLGAVGILRPGISLAQANADLALVSLRLQKLYPSDDATRAIGAVSVASQLLGDLTFAMWTVFAAVIGILLITCANVANMLLAAASSRNREFAVRSALGASRRRLAGQLFVETGVLAIAGGIVGVALAFFGLASLRHAALADLPRIADAHIDAAALVYATILVVATTALAGISPVLTLNRGGAGSAAIKSAGRGGDGSAGNRTRSVFVVIEVSMALALVTLSMLMVRSFYDLTHTDIGIRPAGVVTSDLVALPRNRFSTLAERAAYEKRILTGLEGLPGVDVAALSSSYPLSGISLGFNVGISGDTFPPGQSPEVKAAYVSPGFFRALGIPTIAGRTFAAGDTSGSRQVAIVNQTFVDLYVKGRSPLGVRIDAPGFNGTLPARRTVVGVVGDTRNRLSSPSRATYYVPLAQAPPNFFEVIVHSPGGDPNALGREVRAVFSSTDRTLGIPDTYTYSQLVASSAGNARSITILLATLACIALLLALSGIFGVVSFGVTQRSREFGVRMALGAQARDVLLDVLGRALKVTAVGIAVGLVVAALGARAIASQLYGISPFDPPTFVAVVALLIASAAFAALGPALRATRVDPAVVLRYE